MKNLFLVYLFAFAILPLFAEEDNCPTANVYFPEFFPECFCCWVDCPECNGTGIYPDPYPIKPNVDPVEKISQYPPKPKCNKCHGRGKVRSFTHCWHWHLPNPNPLDPQKPNWPRRPLIENDLGK